MSTIPGALTYLVGACASALPEVQVLDGPPIVDYDTDGLSIGWSPDEMSVTNNIKHDGLDSQREDYEISCLAWARSGDEVMHPTRDRAFGTFNTVKSVVAGDRTLGGVVTKATVGEVEFDQMQGQDGTWCLIQFVIRCLHTART